MERLNFERLRDLVNNISGTIDALEALQADGEALNAAVKTFEEEKLISVENELKRRTARARERYKTLLDTIEQQPRARLKKISQNRYAFLMTDETELLKKQAEATPITPEELERDALLKNPITIPADQVKALKTDFLPLSVEARKYEEQQARLFETLTSQAIAFREEATTTSQQRGHYFPWINNKGVQTRLEALEKGNQIEQSAPKW